MLISSEIKFDFNDIVLVPKALSPISSRSEVDTLRNLRLPLFVAPMDTVVDEFNEVIFRANKLNICFSRNTAVDDIYSKGFKSLSLDEFEKFLTTFLFIDGGVGRDVNILVDIANGHMKKLYDLANKFQLHRKNRYQHLMVGNVANPETFREYALLNVDYVRVGIGGGSACLTSANTGVHYPMASLIHECYRIKRELGSKTKIVADGGFRNFDDIIKALALGADYVMLGGMFNKSLESCAQTKLFNKIPLNRNLSDLIWDKFPKIRKHFYKSYRGMSTKEVQKSWNRKELKTAEGISKSNRVEYKLDTWVSNFDSYLRSAMSYCGAKTLDQFKESNFVMITPNALHRFKK